MRKLIQACKAKVASVKAKFASASAKVSCFVAFLIATSQSAYAAVPTEVTDGFAGLVTDIGTLAGLAAGLAVAFLAMRKIKSGINRA